MIYGAWWAVSPQTNFKWQTPFLLDYNRFNRLEIRAFLLFFQQVVHNLLLSLTWTTYSCIWIFTVHPPSPLLAVLPWALIFRLVPPGLLVPCLLYSWDGGLLHHIQGLLDYRLCHCRREKRGRARIWGHLCWVQCCKFLCLGLCVHGVVCPPTLLPASLLGLQSRLLELEARITGTTTSSLGFSLLCSPPSSIYSI